MTVKNIADLYANAYSQAKRRRGERQILAPLGLTSDAFLEKQGTLSEKFASDIVRELVNFPMPACAALIIGKDASAGYVRSHIFSVENGVLACHNEAGFAAIGVGMYQAMSSLMFAGHAAEQDLDAVIYMTLAAKKRAEMSPGVGKETDIVAITIPDRTYVIFADQRMEEIEGLYAAAEQEHSLINQEAIRRCHEYFEKFRNPVEPPDYEGRVELSGTQPNSKDAGGSGAIAENRRDSKASDIQPLDAE